MSKADLKFMRRALALAEKGGRYVSPNPRVGAVIARGGRVVGEGAHSRFGGPHAEIVALRRAGKKARGATLYVTLEPCCHHGKTPPCAEAVIAAGVSRVVAAMRDPFPLVSGKGFARLRRAGLRVTVGLLEGDSRRMNRGFLFSVLKDRVRVVLKAAMSLDGKIAAVGGRSKWITGGKARRKAHELRADADAILVGSRTVLKDNPSLSVRSPGYTRRDGWPIRVVLDTGLKTRPGMKVYRGPQRSLVFASAAAPRSKEKAFLARGIMVHRVPMAGAGLSLKSVLKVLHGLDARTLLVEGGGQVHASFIREGLADEVALFMAPKVLGGTAPSWVGGEGYRDPNHVPVLEDIRIENLGKDFLLTGKFTPNPTRSNEDSK